MSLPVVLGVGLLGGLGAIARFLLDGAVSRRAAGSFPAGTLAVNLLGSFVLGALAGATITGSVYTLTGTGLIGAFTTFSTWMLESHRLGEDARLRAGILNVALSVVLGVAAAELGRRLGAAL